MKHTIGITLAILAVAVAILAGYIAASAQSQPPCSPISQIWWTCSGTSCEDGILDAFRVPVPDHLAVCMVNFVYQSGMPAAKWGNGCESGLCTFGLPFGPELRAYSQPHDHSIVGIWVWVDPRRHNWLAVLFRNFTPPRQLSVDPYPPPYPYP